jgi:hypothetical protein
LERLVTGKRKEWRCWFIGLFLFFHILSFLFSPLFSSLLFSSLRFSSLLFSYGMIFPSTIGDGAMASRALRSSEEFSERRHVSRVTGSATKSIG